MGRPRVATTRRPSQVRATAAITATTEGGTVVASSVANNAAGATPATVNNLGCAFGAGVVIHSASREAAKRPLAPQPARSASRQLSDASPSLARL